MTTDEIMFWNDYPKMLPLAWIDKIFDEAEEIDHDRDVQTWMAADFTYRNSQW